MGRIDQGLLLVSKPPEPKKKLAVVIESRACESRACVHVYTYWCSSVVKNITARTRHMHSAAHETRLLQQVRTRCQRVDVCRTCVLHSTPRVAVCTPPLHAAISERT